MTEEIRLALFAFLAFLLPVGVYCFVLAAINRRPRPVMIRGVWDAIGLLFALSGFFLATVPALAYELHRNILDAPELPLGVWAWWLAYFAVLVCGAALLILTRANKTMIYNVDPQLFSTIAQQSFASLGLAARLENRRLILTPTATQAGDAISESPRLAAVASARRFGEVAIESFAAMSHVTLHWGRCSPDLRDEVERELDRNLEGAAPADNAAAGWFVSISGMIFGAVLVVLAMFIFLILFSRR